MRECFLILISFLIAGCGTTVPEMQDVFKDKDDEKFDEATLVGQIKCQIRQGVADALYLWQTNGGRNGMSVEWLRSWAAKVTLKITVDEKSSINPGATLIHPYHNAISFFRINGNVTTAQSFSGSIGLQASSDATRVETISFTYVINDLLRQPPPTTDDQRCKLISNFFIESDLKIDEFIVNKTYIAHVPELVDGKPNAGPFTVFSDNITFVVIYAANATPVWKLVQITANNSTPFVNAMRTRTHDLTITLAPISPGSIKGRPPLLSPEGAAIDTAQLIGQATASAIQARTP